MCVSNWNQVSIFKETMNNLSSQNNSLVRKQRNGKKMGKKNKKTELGYWYQKLNVRVNSRVVRQFKVYYFRKWRICSDLREISRLTTARKVYVFGLFLVRIFLHLDWKRTRKAPNADTVYAVDCRLSLLSILPSTKKNLAIMQQNQKNVLLLNFP